MQNILCEIILIRHFDAFGQRLILLLHHFQFDQLLKIVRRLVGIDGRWQDFSVDHCIVATRNDCSALFPFAGSASVGYNSFVAGGGSI